MPPSFRASAFLASVFPGMAPSAPAVSARPVSTEWADLFTGDILREPPEWGESPVDTAATRITPLYLGDSGGGGADRFSAWWHPASRAEVVSSGIGVVMCSAFGREELSSHATLRVMATQLAEIGVDCMRFDYPGTGDAGGSEIAPDAVARWLKSIDVAAQSLRELSGVKHLVFLGLRAGALLAMHAAVKRRDVVGLACWMPVLSGRTHLRELRMLNRNLADATDGVFESGGHAMHEAVRDTLQRMDARRLRDLDVPRWLVLERDDLYDPQGIEDWCEQLRRDAQVLAHDRLPGYPAMMLDPHHARVPLAWCEATRAWVKSLTHTLEVADRAEAVVARMLGWAPASRPAPAASLLARAEVLDLGAVRERFVRIPLRDDADPTLALDGVWSGPTRSSAGTDARVVLLINAGAARRVGPGRLYVKLARDLARAGHTVLRVDLSGLGESGVRPGQDAQVSYPLTAVDEILQTVAHLNGITGRPVQLIGLCAGAYHSIQAAVRAVRVGVPALCLSPQATSALVGGVLAINPLTFQQRHSLPPPGALAPFKVVGEMQRYRAGLGSWARWKRLLSGQASLAAPWKVFKQKMRSSVDGVWRDLRRGLGFPRSNDVGQQLLDVMGGRIALGFVFAEQDPGAELLRSEVGRVRPRLQKLGMLEIPVAHADHTFTQWAWREALSREVQAWVGRAG